MHVLGVYSPHQTYGGITVSQIFFDPWIGGDYGTANSLFSKKVLVLGSSHYCGSCSDCGDRAAQPECVEMTQKVVRHYLEGKTETWFSTFSTFINSIYGRRASADERKKFFSSVAFYNFLQNSAGEDPKSASRFNFYDSRHLEAFYEALDITDPDVVISWGAKVWDALPNNWRNYGEALRGQDIIYCCETFNNYLTYPFKNGKTILLIGVKHPAMGYGRAFHHNIFSRLLPV